jgi:hypothetical protein
MDFTFCFSSIFRILQHVRIKCISSSERGFSSFSNALHTPRLPHFPWFSYHWDLSCLSFGNPVSTDQNSKRRWGKVGVFQHSSPSHAPFSLPTQIGLIFTSCQSLHLSTALSLAIQLLPPHTASACLPLLALSARFTSLSSTRSLHFTGLADRPVFPLDCLAPADNYPYPLPGGMMRPPLTSLCSS